MEAASLTFVGHSTVLLRLGGATLITDPVLRGRIGHLRRVGRPVAGLVPQLIDAVLVSHVHQDHHLDPARAASALTLLRPRIAVPVHWGSLSPLWAPARSPAARRQPAQRFAREAAVTAPGVDVRILEPGEALALPD